MSGNAHIFGGAIYNKSLTGNATINSIIGDFIGNHANYNGTDAEKNALGGAIYNDQGTISNITGDFIGNFADGGENSAFGGAISNIGARSKDTDVITNITGDFIGNYVKGSFNAHGGAISNTTFTKIENITGDFIGNYADGAASGAQGGAIYNVTSTINNITGDFIDNYVDASNNTLHFGGAIYSKGVNDYPAAINNITGDFIGNHAKSGGGAIANLSYSTITNITGDFINNYASGDDIAAKGGAIYKEGGTIKNIKGNFINNYVDGSNDSNDSGYNGGAIFNGGAIAIENIIGDFTGNHAKNRGGAIYNESSAKIDNITGDFINNYTNTSGGAIYNNTGTIKNITGNFEGNYVSGSYAFGGAIYTTSGKIENIKGSFIGNYANATKDAAAKGGAIYNITTISNLTGDFIGNYANAKEFGTSVRIAHGGAIYNFSSGKIENITGDFINNYVSGGAVFGGAIYNNGGKITIKTKDDKDIKFENNYVTSNTNGSNGGAIYNTNTGTINLLANEGKSITFVGGADTTGKYDIDGIYNAGTLNINGDDTTTTTGTVNLYKLDGTGKTTVYGGTLTAKGDITQNVLDINADTFDLAQNNLNTINVKTLSIADTAKLIIDVDLQNKTGDYFNSDKFVINNGTVDVGAGLTISSVNFLNDYKTIADGAKIELFSASGSTNLSGLKIKDYAEVHAGTTEDDTYAILFKQDTTNKGVLNVIKETPSSANMSLPAVIQATAKFYDKSIEISKYNIEGNGNLLLSANLGTLKDYGDTPRNLTINGNGHVIEAENAVGTKYSGVIVGNGQTLTVNNEGFYNFGAISGGNGSAINNSGTVNLNNSLVSYGQAAYGGAIYNNSTGSLDIIGGKFYGNEATTNDGGTIYNLGTISNITSDFESNHAKISGGAIYNVGTIKNITGDFDSNYASTNTYGGGAICNISSGKFENITSNFSKNYSNKDGGAIWNTDTGSITIHAQNGKDVKFDGNYVTYSSGLGGAIYNTISGTVNLLADAGRSITFVGGEDDTVNNKYDIDGIYNAGTLNINGDGTITP
ncbi:MAG: hypothetical protein MJ229_01030, partial [bacterium]|nr:hypothetical protein [bacterium]